LAAYSDGVILLLAIPGIVSFVYLKGRTVQVAPQKHQKLGARAGAFVQARLVDLKLPINIAEGE
jgi:hypothetical protein